MKIKKKIIDITFKEFDNWANARACDGKWSCTEALVSSEIIREVFKINSIFNRNKKREDKWDELKSKYFDLNAEIKLDQEVL